MNYFFALLVFLFGAIFGSFLNVVILRLPKRQTLGGRSHCTTCGHVLSPWELLPLVSFLWLGGRCHSCKARISPRYFIIESVTGLLFLAGWLVIAPKDPLSALLFFKWLCMAAVCLVIFVIDLEHYIILDKIVFPALALVLLLSLIATLLGHQSVLSLSSPFVSAIFGAAAGSLPFFILWYFSKGEWMGFGDVKLMLLLGAAVGLPLVVIALLLAIWSGGLVSGGLLLFSNKTMQSKVPFGTFLTGGALVTLLFGPQLLHWYLGILGF